MDPGSAVAPHKFDSLDDVMRRAIEIARRCEGRVEPNPQVGAVLVYDDLNLVAEGWHQSYGGPHAEVVALQQAGARSRGATAVVTLEPCAHFGKTPPCADALIAAGIRRVIVGIEDPFAEVAGRGINKLREAGIPVETGLQADAVRKLTAPFLKLVQTGRPYVHAKWAMTLDGKIATRTGASRWISNEASRQIVHELRGRMDAILVGVETALKDDPLLTARPAGLRTALRIVLDSRARLPMTSQLVQTAHEIPVLLATGPAAREEDLKQLEKAGVEILVLPAAQSSGDRRFPDPGTLLDTLGKRRLTNLLVEGGGGVLGSFFDALLIDFVHVFIAPKVFGGIHAPGPVGGDGLALPPQIPNIDGPEMDIVQGDLYVRGALKID